MAYLWWYDETPKKATVDKCRDAIAAYTEREGRAPNVVCVWTEADMPETFSGCRVQRESYIRINNVWVGYDATN